jgi:hypothetical protein
MGIGIGIGRGIGIGIWYKIIEESAKCGRWSRI